MRTDPNDPDGFVDVEEFFKTIMHQSLTRKVLKLARSGSVLFCPGCAMDWQPLLRMTDTVRCLVFCTQQTGKEVVDIFDPDQCLPENLRPLLTKQVDETISVDLMREVGITSFQAGQCAELRRNIGMVGGSEADFKRPIIVASLHANPIEVYKSLFPANGPGPKFLCLLQSGMQNGLPNDPAQVPDAAPARYVIDRESSIRVPWLRYWQAYPDWDRAMVFQRPDQPAHPLQEYPQIERFMLSPDPISPEWTHDTDAVHLTVQQYMSHQWLGGRRTILLDAAPEVVAAIRLGDDRVRPLRLLGRPLCEVLPALVEATVGLNCTAIHVGRLGLEDEANCIGPIWSKHGASRTLVVHCEHELDGAAVQGLICDDPDA